MIHELATIEIIPGHEDGFERGVRAAVPLLKGSRGCRSVELRRSIEAPSRYLLIIGWDTVEDHMTHFRNSPAFAEWRALVGPHFTAAPAVQHVENVDLG